MGNLVSHLRFHHHYSGPRRDAMAMVTVALAECVQRGQSSHSPSCACGSLRSFRCSRIRIQSIEMAYLNRHSRRRYSTHTFADEVTATVV